MSRLPARDLADISERHAPLWRELAGAHVLVTGAGGFVGSWVLESILHATDERGIALTATALVRDSGAFRAHLPHLANDARLSVVAADVRHFTLDRAPTHIVHAASATSPDRHALDPAAIIDTIESGTRRVLDVAAAATRTVVVSSGSVYDRASAPGPRITEGHATLTEGESLAQRFGAAKRRAERLVEDSDVTASIARIFTVVGPRLPVDGQFAVGQFLGDALANRTIRLSGDGSPVRSYLYSADLVSWLLTILFLGEPRRAYNVGSEGDRDLGDVADRVSRLRTPRLKVTRGASLTPSTPDRYIPDTRRAREELGLEAWTDFPEALNRTWAWLCATRA